MESENLPLVSEPTASSSKNPMTVQSVVAVERAILLGLAWLREYLKVSLLWPVAKGT